MLAALAGLALMVAPAGRAATNTWLAGGNLLWTNTANWSATALPGAADTANFTNSNVGTVDLSATTQSISALAINANGYGFTNGTLALNAINLGYGNGAAATGTVNVTDYNSGGIVINLPTVDQNAPFTLSGQITVNSTASNAFSTVQSQQKYGALTFGSTAAGVTNSVAGGVCLNDGINNNQTLFQGTWTIGGDFQAVKGGASSIQLKNSVTIGGHLANRTTNGNNDRPTTLQIMATTSDVKVGGDLIMDGSYVVGNGQCSILIDKALKLQGNVLIYGGRLRTSVTDPILNYSTGLADTGKVIYLGNTSGTKIA